MKKRKKKFYEIFFIVLFVFIGWGNCPCPVLAIEPLINDIIITNDKENVLLYARVVNGF